MPRLPVSRRFFLALCLGALCGFGLAPHAGAEPVLTLFHTNDVHGHVLPAPNRAGFAHLAGFLHAQTSPWVLVDAGDGFSGHPFANSGRGEAVADLYRRLGYAALAVGNHEFDYGAARFLDLKKRFDLPFVAINIDDSAQGNPLLPPWVVREVGGVRLGIFGVSTPETRYSAHPKHVAALAFADAEALFERARAVVRRLRVEERVDLVVALTHLGSAAFSVPSSLELARQVSGIDLIVDGHSHSRLAHWEGHALIVSAGAHFEALGVVAMSRDEAGRWRMTPRLIPNADLRSATPDPEIAALLVERENQMAAEGETVIGHLRQALPGERPATRRQPTALGALVTDAMKKAARADAALINSGSIRAGLPKGAVRLSDLRTALPYANTVCVVEVSGAELAAMLAYGRSRPGSGAYPQYSPPTAPLQLNARYTLAINDFLAAGGDGFKWFSNRPCREAGTLEDAIKGWWQGSEQMADH